MAVTRRLLETIITAIPTAVQSVQCGHSVCPALLSRIGFIAQGDFPAHKVHRAFQAGHPLFQIAHVVGNLIDAAPYMPEVFKNQIFYIFVHGLLPCQVLKYIAAMTI